MPKPPAIPAERVSAPDPAGFLAACEDGNSLVYFLFNVGDGDTQLVLLPRVGGAPRRALVVDIAEAGKTKLPGVVAQLQGAGVLRAPAPDASAPPHRKAFPIVVGTHPHDDHIGGLPDFLDLYRNDVAEYWDPGYYHPTIAFIETMRRLEDSPHIVWTQPTSGLRRFVDDVRVTVLAPSIVLKHRYDSYGVDPNNASVTLKIEFPYRRVQERTSRAADEAAGARERRTGRLYARIPSTRSLVLGADAQALSWAQVQSDFPKLDAKQSPIFSALKMARGLDPLKATVFKVSHHSSKRGVYLELVELFRPDILLVSSVAEKGKYGFPHAVTQEALREARQRIAKSGARRADDWALGIFYTADESGDGEELGTMALVVPPSGTVSMWRFGDRRGDDVDLNRARRVDHTPPG